MPGKRAVTIAETLEERIFSGAYTDGDRLDEVTLAQEFDVSRTPIREALQLLVKSALAEQLPRRGVFVRQPGPGKLEELFEAMAEIEAACGRLAAARISSEALSGIEAANAQCMIAIEAQDTGAYSHANELFHDLIYTASGNSFLAAEARKLFERLKPFRRVQLRLDGRMEQSMREHKMITEALKHADGSTTAKALRQHVRPQGESFYPQIAQLSAAE